MDRSKWIAIGKGLAIGAAYCVTYRQLWDASFDQWFLPAGLRVTVFMLVSYRLWPYLLAGDAVALLLHRTTLTDKDYSLVWIYLSPFLVGPLIATLIHQSRKRFPTIEKSAQWLPLIAAALALWGTGVAVAINYWLSGPPSFDTLQKMWNYAMGNFLGILMLALPAYLFRLRDRLMLLDTKFIRDVSISACLIAAGYAITIETPKSDQLTSQMPTLLMGLPIIWLTFTHGWRGAAIGIFMVNFAIAMTMEHTGIQGAFDERAADLQLKLSIASAGMLLLGSKISLLFDRTKLLGLSERQAFDLAKSNSWSNERVLREHVLFIAQLHISMDEQRKELVDLLKSQGKSAEAMKLNSAAVEHRRWFESQICAIYPLGIEEKGLYGVIFPESFTDFWTGSTVVRFVLVRGQPKILSEEIQVAAYRCICNAFAVLLQESPHLFTVKLHAWKRKNRQGISFKITAHDVKPIQTTRAGAFADADLERRVKVYGGAIGRRHKHCVHVLLWEPAESKPSSTNDGHLAGR